MIRRLEYVAASVSPSTNDLRLADALYIPIGTPGAPPSGGPSRPRRSRPGFRRRRQGVNARYGAVQSDDYDTDVIHVAATDDHVLPGGRSTMDSQTKGSGTGSEHAWRQLDDPVSPTDTELRQDCGVSLVLGVAITDTGRITLTLGDDDMAAPTRSPWTKVVYHGRRRR